MQISVLNLGGLEKYLRREARLAEAAAMNNSRTQKEREYYRGRMSANAQLADYLRDGTLVVDAYSESLKVLELLLSAMSYGGGAAEFANRVADSEGNTIKQRVEKVRGMFSVADAEAIRVRGKEVNNG